MTAAAASIASNEDHIEQSRTLLATLHSRSKAKRTTSRRVTAMNIQAALLPNKHVRFCDSLIASAGRLRALLEEPRTVDELWAAIEHRRNEWPGTPSFAQVVLAVDVLFAIGQVRAAPGGRVVLR